jgi:hypothetical protein
VAAPPTLRCLTPTLYPQYQPRVAEYPAFADSFAAALAEAEAGAAGKRGGEAPPRAGAPRKARRNLWGPSAPPPARGARPLCACAEAPRMGGSAAEPCSPCRLPAALLAPPSGMAVDMHAWQ